MNLRPYQSRAIGLTADCLQRGGSPILVMPTGSGKCLGIGTPVLLHDGTVIPVEEVRPGDRLMGPDSRPRAVLSTCRGTGPLFRITPNRGRPWICNDVHVLTLAESGTGKLVDIPLDEYLSRSKTFRHTHKQFSVGVDWPAAEQTISPYFIGAWLGDGTKALRGIAITKNEAAIREACAAEAARFGLTVREEDSNGTRCVTYHLVSPAGQKNPLLDEMRGLMLGVPHIPRNYLIASWAQRMELLAGIVDTDGHLGGGYIEIAQKSDAIADGIEFLAKSLGFSVGRTVKVVDWAGSYHRMSICGDISTIPCRIARKKAAHRKINKDATRTGFSVEPIGEGEYAGFQLDGDGRFLLGDFTVTHNTITAVGLIAGNPGRSLFLAPRRELVHQAAEKLESAGIPPGIIMAGEDPNSYRKVQVASVQTLYARLKRGVMMPSAGLVIVDEAHLALSRSTLEVLKHYADAYKIGLTATPARGDGRGLNQLFTDLIEVTTVKELTEQGYLCDAIYYAPSKPDLREVQIDSKTHDYKPGQLAKAVDRPELVGDIVAHWHKLAAGRRTVVFASSIEHSQHLANEFNGSGIRAEHVDAITPHAQREAIFQRFRSGETQILTNCFLASYGFDLPDLSCVVLARPTKSIVLYLQMVGRGLRPSPGKDRALILDHAGCVHQHGFADFPHEWSLDGLQTVAERAEAKRKERKESKPHTCGSCKHVFQHSLTCPKCGWNVPRPAKTVQTLKGDLERVKGERQRDNRRIFAELRMYAVSGNYAKGWAAHKYREIFGAFPPWDWNNDQLMVPSAETAGLVQYLQIKWRNQKRKEARGKASA